MLKSFEMFYNPQSLPQRTSDLIQQDPVVRLVFGGMWLIR